jgi:hypothetical protein
LDPFNETEDEYMDEQKAIRAAERAGSFEEEDIMFPSRAMFRGAGELRQRRRHTVAHTEPLVLAEMETVVATQMADNQMMRMADASGRSKDLLHSSSK